MVLLHGTRIWGDFRSTKLLPLIYCYCLLLFKLFASISMKRQQRRVSDGPNNLQLLSNQTLGASDVPQRV